MEKGERVCGKCWQVYKIGARHDCKPAAPARPAPPRRPAETRALGTNADVNRGTNARRAPRISNALKMARWRRRHAEHYRSYMQGYMRAWRKRRRIQATAVQATQ